MTRDPAAKYLSPRRGWMRNPRFFFFGKRLELLLGIAKKLKRGREV